MVMETSSGKFLIEVVALIQKLYVWQTKISHIKTLIQCLIEPPSGIILTKIDSWTDLCKVIETSSGEILTKVIQQRKCLIKYLVLDNKLK